MPALRSCDEQHQPVLAPAYISKPQAQHDIDELAAMSIYDHSQGAILSPTPRAISFPSYPMLDISLDGPTPRAFTFPSSVQDSLSLSRNSNRGPPFTPPEPSPSTPSASPSPFEPERRDKDQQQQSQPQFTAPHIARRSQSVQRARAGTASPAAQISSFNAPDSNPGAPLTLAARRRGSSISSLALPVHPQAFSHSLSLNQPASQPDAQAQSQPPSQTQTHNPHVHAIQLAGTERRPKRGDEDYIKRPENAFILFRRECCLRKNETEAAAAAEGDPVQRRQRQADLSKTISQQWRSLSAEERKYWDELAKQRKKEHEEMYPWYVYQPSRTEKSKKKVETAAGGKVKREKESKKERRDRTKSTSRVRGSGSRARNMSSCSAASTRSTTTVSSSASTVDSEDFSELDSLSADGSLYNPYGFPSGACSSVREVEVADMADFDMNESEGSQGHAQSLSLPLSFSMPSLSGQSGPGANLAIDTRNALASFSLESGPITMSSYSSHSHHGGHGHGHGHSLSAQISSQTAQSFVPGPLSFVLPQNRRSTSAPGAPTPPSMPVDLYEPAVTIKIPQLLETSSGSNSNSAIGSPVSREGSDDQINANVQQRKGEYGALSGFHFPNPQSQPMGYGMPGQVPNFSSAGGEMSHNSMFQIYDEPATAKPRPRALSQLTIPTEPPTSPSGPLSAPAPPSDSSAPPSHLFLPQQFSPLNGQSPNGHLQVPQRAIPIGLPESPEPPAGTEWNEYGLPAWAMSTLCDSDDVAMQSSHHPNQETHPHSQDVFGEIDIGMDMGLPPWMGFESMESMNAMGGMSGMSHDMDSDGGRMDPYAMHFRYEDLLDASQQL